MDENIFRDQMISKGYYVFEQIGKGGFSLIYRVKSLKFEVEFAAKVIIENHNKVQTFQMFNNEINLLMRLDHPNIIKVYDSFYIDLGMILVLEYCPNGSLFDEISSSGPLKEIRFLKIAKEVLEVLIFSHSQNIAHRDIKPHNILFDNYGRVKLADFGIGIITHNSSFSQDFHCSRPFASPELLEKKPYNPMLADIWSLGATFAYILTGSLPFPIRNTNDHLISISKEILDFPNSLNPSIKTLLVSMMKFNPEERMPLEYVYKRICEYYEIESQTPYRKTNHGKYVTFQALMCHRSRINLIGRYKRTKSYDSLRKV